MKVKTGEVGAKCLLKKVEFTEGTDHERKHGAGEKREDMI
jgi:hypothetical protein